MEQAIFLIRAKKLFKFKPQGNIAFRRGSKGGLRTSEDAFRLPILKSLQELGGSVSVKEVLKNVHNKMIYKLNEYDYQTLPSDPDQPRWMNAAQWCRNSMVKEGHLSTESPRGIWEMSLTGRTELSRFRK